VGKTPDLKVPGLSLERPHKAQASKAGFQTINLVIDNPNKLETLEQKLSMIKDEGAAPKETKPPPKKEEPPPKEKVAEKPPAKKEEPPKEKVADKPPPKKEESAPPPKKEETPKEAAAVEAPKKGGKAKGKFACATKPLGAEVWVDGKNTGEKTPISLSKAIDLAVGKHKVLFKLNGKTSGPHEITVNEGEVAKLTGITFE
jgi:hypothetical protein